MELELVLEKYFGYSSFREPQKKIIEEILKGRDTLTILPTGGGKSIIYQVPGLILEGLVLVVSPLVSLMRDQVENLKKNKIKACFINSEQDVYERRYILNNLSKYKFVYVSAERLENEEFLRYVKEVSLLVIDEAHTIKWGADFRKSLYHITNFVNKLIKRPIIACFTATLNKQEVKLIVNKAGLNNPFITSYLPIKNNLSFKVYKRYKKHTLDLILKQKKKTIVYTLTRKKAFELYNIYQKYYDCYYYHGALSSEIKKKNYLGFKNSDKGVIFATNSFGMGIDITNIRNIVLYDLPINMSDLIQQAGRAGRDGLASTCYIFIQKSSIETSLSFIYNSSEQKEKIKELNAVIKFCYTKDKEVFIKKYFSLE